MKILLVASHIAPTEGWGTEALTSVRGLRARGHEVQVLVHRRYGGDECVQHVLLPDPFLMLRPSLAWLRALRATRRVVRRWQPDIVHVTTEPYAVALAAVFPAARSGSRLVLTANGTYSIVPLASWKTRRLMKAAYRRCSRVLAVSHYTHNRLSAYLSGLDPRLSAEVQGKLSVLSLGIELPQRRPLRRTHEEKQLLFVGGVKPRKGVMEVIEACSVFRRLSPTPFHLHIMGSAPETWYTRMLRARVTELGLSSVVTFHGQVSDETLAQAYVDADLFLMLSRSAGLHFEGYGLVFLEANARGVPVIGPFDSGCTDAIADGRSGYTVDPTNPGEVVTRMRWILEEGRIPSEACRAWATEHSIWRQAEGLEHAYTDALGEDRSVFKFSSV